MISPLFGVGISNKSVDVTAQSRVNLYVEIQQDEDKTKLALYRMPGSSLFATMGDTPIRGMYSLGNFLYVVHRGTFWEINNAGVKTSRGTLTTTIGKVSIVDNGTQILIVDGSNGYYYTPGTTVFVQIPQSGTSAGFPNSPISCTFQASFFIVVAGGTQKFFVSGSYDAATWNALQFAAAETNPDNLLAIISDHGELIPFGDVSAEFWQPSGALDFAFMIEQGAQAEWGIAAQYSLAKLGESVIFLSKNRLGESNVSVLNGHSAFKVSSSELDSILNAGVNSDATAISYALDGHLFYQLNLPTLNQSWLYDATSSKLANQPVWSQLKSYGLQRQRFETQTNYLGRVMFGDYSNGNIYYLDRSVQTDNGNPIYWTLIGKHVGKGEKVIRCSRLYIDVETGTALQTGQGSDPLMMLDISKDDGHTYPIQRTCSLGKVGVFATRCVFRRLGRSGLRGTFTFRLSGSEPIKTVIVGAGIK